MRVNQAYMLLCVFVINLFTCDLIIWYFIKIMFDLINFWIDVIKLFDVKVIVFENVNNCNE